MSFKILRVNIKAILKDPVLRRDMMIPAIQAIQNRERIGTTREQAERAYDKVQDELAQDYSSGGN